jgi:hypothetical protein
MKDRGGGGEEINRDCKKAERKETVEGVELKRRRPDESNTNIRKGGMR